ncbi:HigA family addiction module antitoxin [Bacteroidota bacterium]
MYKLKRKPTHPGVILKEDFLIPFGISQTQLAYDIKTTFRTVNEIINEKRNLSSEMAVKLAKYFGTSVELWLNLQNQYDIYKIFRNKSRQIDKIKPFSELTS